MASVEPAQFAKTVFKVAEDSLPKYSNKYSKRVFTQPQLLSVLCFMRYQNWSFRETVSRLADSRELLEIFGLAKVPDHSTLYYFSSRVGEECLQNTYQEAIQRVSRSRPASASKPTVIPMPHTDQIFKNPSLHRQIEPFTLFRSSKISPPPHSKPMGHNMQLNRSIEIPRIQHKDSFLRFDILLVLIASFALFLFVFFESWLQPLAPIRLVLGLLYVLLIPGYWLSVALFPGANDLNRTQRTAISLGLSAAWVPILALVLDNLPGGLHLWPIFFGEHFSTLAFMILALLRQSKLTTQQPYIPRVSWRPDTWWGARPISQKKTYIVALIALATGLVRVSMVFLVPAPAEYMTEFYVMGKGGLAEGYPRELRSGEPFEVTLGITNRERSEHNYRVEVWVEDPWAEGRTELVAENDRLLLDPGETFEWPMKWQMPWQGKDQKVLILLFMDHRSEPYRRLRLFVNVQPSK